eukprot:15458954-Alexandrium_andersonii.AAC.1
MSGSEYPTYKYLSSIALEALRSEPSIFAEWGACLRRLARSVNEAFAGTAKGVDESNNPVRSGGPHYATAFLKS